MLISLGNGQQKLHVVRAMFDLLHVFRQKQRSLTAGHASSVAMGIPVHDCDIHKRACSKPTDSMCTSGCYCLLTNWSSSTYRYNLLHIDASTTTIHTVECASLH